MVKYFHRSPKALTKPIGLVSDVITRWNFTYDMLARMGFTKAMHLAVICLSRSRRRAATVQELLAG